MFVRRCKSAVWFGVFSLLCGQAARTYAADDVRTVDENGVTYRVTTRTVQRPITETKTVEHERTILKEKVSTETKSGSRTYYVPITEYVAQPYIEGRWNPFAQPYVAYHYVPVTRWEPRTEQYQVQVPNRELVPEKQTVKVPIVSQRLVEETYTSKVAIGQTGRSPTDLSPRSAVAGSGGLLGSPSDNSAANMAARPRLDSDPRGPGAGNPWQAAPEPGRLR